MKLRQLPFAFAIVFSCDSLVAAETNTIYITDGEGITLMGPVSECQNSIRLAAALALAKTNKECWSSELFTEGNWGESTNGIQVSLRLDKSDYQSGEPIKATVLVRNTRDVTNSCFVYLWSNPTTGGDIDYLVFDHLNQPLARKPDQRPKPFMGGANFNSVMGGSQRKHIDQLNRTYDLTNGHYWVQASITSYIVEDENVRPLKVFTYDIRSAKVPLKIK